MNDPNPTPAQDPPNPPANPPADPGPAVDPPNPPDNTGTVDERLNKITDAVSGLVEAVAKLAGANKPPDPSPARKPWTSWGSRS